MCRNQKSLLNIQLLSATKTPAAAAPAVRAYAAARGLTVSIGYEAALPAAARACNAGTNASMLCGAPPRVVLQQAVPWWLQLWAHTLEVARPDAQANALCCCLTNIHRYLLSSPALSTLS